MRHFIDRLRVCQSGADTWCSCHALWSVTESCFGSFSTKRAATGVAPRCLFSTRGERRRKTTPETSGRITQTLQSVGLRRRCRHWLRRLGLYTSAFLNEVCHRISVLWLSVIEQWLSARISSILVVLDGFRSSRDR